jgi:HEAT repeat protein
MKDDYHELAEIVLCEVRSKGFSVHSFAELRRVKQYQQLIPLLLKWLRQVDDKDLKEDLVRTMSLPCAGPEVARAFVEEFRAADDFFLKWAIGNGLSIVADDTVADDLFELVRDRRHGRAREMLALALANLRDPHAPAVARKLLSDEDVQGHAVIALRKLKAYEAKDDVARLLKHPKSWIRAEAKKALRSFEKIAGGV